MRQNGPYLWATALIYQIVISASSHLCLASASAVGFGLPRRTLSAHSSALGGGSSCRRRQVVMINGEKKPSSILFVCLGNINRSAAAEGYMRSKRPSLHVESAGTGGHFAGAAADDDMQLAARQRGVDLSSHRARQVTDQDFVRFDMVVAMDSSNLRSLQQRCPAAYQSKLHLFLPKYASHLGLSDTPDPYYEGGHLRVFDIISQGIDGLIASEKL
ncbi:unnamed protein product [Vitrella brassicaformis CCMP3155]|uniref:Phosphotyrosine protein phosphatase I domain-containing protein n=2 Tax=Vitrella brassicaformis TaxID=1169539 RepID=A0A0G4EVH7_VITBC|nr:unnamed protein product [Vitrella brassicaformis CCMP3155]|eukprot:CEM02276.1 unnamed protein product [Vitrella brassicaformis CCMP3155]